MREVVIVVGDSVGAPRPWVGVNLKRTYAFQLNQQLGCEYYVVNYCESNNSTENSIKEGFLRTYLRASDASFAVIQLGIVDCAPRLMSPFERFLGALAARWSPAQRLFAYYVRKKAKYRYAFTKWFPKTLVPIERYEDNYRKLLGELFNNNPIKKAYLVNIAYPGDVLISRSYNILGNIRDYNSVLERLASEFSDRVELIDIYGVTEEKRHWITPDDGHHLVGDAHDWIACAIAQRIAQASAGSSDNK